MPQPTPPTSSAPSNPPVDLARAIDLLRFCRHKLHEENLISDDEFTSFLLYQGAVARLESYDEVRAKLTAAEAEVVRLRAALDASERQRDQWFDEWSEHIKPFVQADIATAVAAEREACAMLAEEIGEEFWQKHEELAKAIAPVTSAFFAGGRGSAGKVALAIRARNPKQSPAPTFSEETSSK